MIMNQRYTYLMTMTLERSKSGNAIKDFIEQFRKNMFIEEEEEYEDDFEEEQYFDDDDDEDDDLYEDDDTEPATKKEDKKKTLYIGLNAFIKDWEFFFESAWYEPHEVPEEFVLIENLYDREAIRIKLDDLTDEKILAHSKEITGEEKMPIVEFYREDDGTIDMLIGFYCNEYEWCENPYPD